LGADAVLHPHRQGAEVGHVGSSDVTRRQHVRRAPILGEHTPGANAGDFFSPSWSGRTMYRCIAAIPNVGGNCIEHFYPDTPEGHVSAEEFAQRYNQDGWGVYDCVSPLKEERRTKDNVAQITGLHVDLDARSMKETKEQIVETIRSKLLPFGIV